MSLAPWESPGKRLVLDDIEKRKGNMTKQHFEIIADLLRFARKRLVTDDELAELFADKLALIYPRFDRDRFLKAAGVE